MSKNYINVYNNLINYSRNKDLYKSLNREDNFSDRLTFFLIHLAFFLKKFRKITDQKYLQDFYDYTFKQIEHDIREIGYGDQSVNKKMKTYVNLLYSIINKIDNWENYSSQQKMDLLKIFIEINDNNEKFLEYFDKYSHYLSKISFNLFTKSVIDHRF